MMAKGRFYYKRFYALVAVAVAVMTGVLTGSLLLGDSVRWSLAERVNERLGNAETLIQTGTGFLNESILNNRLLAGARGYLLAEGFVSTEGQMIPVAVWGSDAEQLKPGEVLVNEGLATLPAPLVLHLPSNNLVSSGSLFISQSHATQLRLSVKGVKTARDGGNLLLHNEQVRPLNIFMNRQELAEALGVQGRMNVIMSPEPISEEQFNSVWKPEDSGLTLTTYHSPLTSLVVGTDRVFLPRAVVDSLKPSARYLAYFVNSLGDIPYSFVTATDELQGDETILTDYAARRMDVRVGDSITMEYYVSQGGLKQLATRSHRFLVSRIVPVSEFQSQEELITADFPGLSGVKNCTDWDSDLPIDMSRITKEDEDYWADYRQLPKALVSLDAVGKDWTGPYGSATKAVVGTSHLLPLTSHLSPQIFGITVVQPRKAALAAAQNGTDFGLLFMALGFFIIVAAVLLMQNPLSEMYQQRRGEIQLLGTLGFSRRQVMGRLFTEALPVVLSSALAGVLLGCAYAAIILWLLAGPWSGATHTDGFALHVNPLTALLSLLIALVLALLVLALAVRSGIREHKAPVPRGFVPANGKPVISLSTLHFSFLRYYRRQHRLSFWTLALGVLIVFAVGLNRPDFSHSSESATGGYQYFAESRIPLQYDLNTAAGRWHLHLGDLPADARFLQMPKHVEDEASCLNLNRVETPSVLGMSLEDMSGFGIDTTHFSPLTSHLLPLTSHLLPLTSYLSPLTSYLSPLRVAVDEEALLWSMMKQVGDTLTYHTSDGQTVRAVIAATYPTGILHGNAIMPLEHFRQLWPDEAGSRILLMAGGHSETTTLLTSLLSDYGLTITTTTDRLRLFFEVTDTYLSIFLSLGGLGLLLGLVSLLVVIRKNLTARRDEIRLYHTLGFSTQTIVTLLRREQLIVPLLAILAGSAVCLIISLLLSLTSHLSPLASPLSPLVLFLLILLFTWIVIHISINPKTIKQCENYSS